MTNKELKRLSRSELLELLLIQTRETERLARKLEAAEAMLADRQLKLDKAGDIAHAVLEINGVMEAAQEAARQYLDNVKRMDQEASQRAEKLMSSARQEIDRAWKEIEQARQDIERSRKELEVSRQSCEQARRSAAARKEAAKASAKGASEQDLISEIYTLLDRNMDS